MRLVNDGKEVGTTHFLDVRELYVLRRVADCSDNIVVPGGIVLTKTCMERSIKDTQAGEVDSLSPRAWSCSFTVVPCVPICMRRSS